ncbi:MAG: prepilin-type N-terminal cleavage/methylation domain-containing protein, partial [Campylobacterota bacterium]|nr:prepilin-type N-terminal cleavage/methylation domain-containing protein [Campylobacterota bacterium]
MQKKAFTLLEMIFVVVISGVLAMGTFKAMEALYVRSAKAKAITELSMQSQIVLDQIGVMLYNRVPNSV